MLISRDLLSCILSFRAILQHVPILLRKVLGGVCSWAGDEPLGRCQDARGKPSEACCCSVPSLTRWLSLACWASQTHPKLIRSDKGIIGSTSSTPPGHFCVRSGKDQQESLAQRAFLMMLTLQNSRWVIERLHEWYRNPVRGIASTFSSIWRHLASIPVF